MTDSLRERKKRDVRARIALAAFELFRTRGFHNCTIEEIADAADISRRSFFRYFPVKEAALFPLHEMRMDQFSKLMTFHADKPGLTRLRQAAIDLASDYGPWRKEAEMIFVVIDGCQELITYERGLDESWEKVVIKCLLEDGYPEDLARIVASAMMAVKNRAMRAWAYSPRDVQLADLFTEYFGYLEHGFSTRDKIIVAEVKDAK